MDLVILLIATFIVLIVVPYETTRFVLMVVYNFFKSVVEKIRALFRS